MKKIILKIGHLMLDIKKEKKKKTISQNIFTLAIKKEKNKNKNLYIDSSEKMSFWSIYAMSKTQFFKWCTR